MPPNPTRSLSTGSTHKQKKETDLQPVDARVEVGEEPRVQFVHHHDRPLPRVRQHLFFGGDWRFDVGGW